MRYLYFLLSVYLWLSCNTKTPNSFYEIVNQNFIHFTDTTAYKYHTFFPAPNDTITTAVSATGKLFITVNTFFEKSDRIIQSLTTALNSRGADAYTALLKTKQEAPLTALDLSKITNTGHYTIMAEDEFKKENNKPKGHITFQKPFLSEEKAIIILSIASSPEAGRTTAFLIEKEKENWNIKETIELERW